MVLPERDEEPIEITFFSWEAARPWVIGAGMSRVPLRWTVLGYLALVALFLGLQWVLRAIGATSGQ